MKLKKSVPDITEYMSAESDTQRKEDKKNENTCRTETWEKRNKALRREKDGIGEKPT